MSDDRRQLTAADLVEPYGSRLAKQSYGAAKRIEGVIVDALPVHRSTDGAFAELLRLDEVGQVEGLRSFVPRQWSWSLLEPGAVKAWHLHLAQDDLWLIPPNSHLLVGLVDVRRHSATSQERMRLTLGGGPCHRVFIPKGVAHGVANLSSHPQVVIYAASRQFSSEPDRTDEWRLPAETFGDDFWQIDRN